MQLFKFPDPTMVGQLVFLNLIAIYKKRDKNDNDKDKIYIVKD